MTRRDFERWLERDYAPPVVYYRGHLLIGQISKVAILARLAYMRGLVHLTQRRLGDDDYEYIATKRRGF